MDKLITWQELGQLIAKMTPAQLAKPVLTFDGNVGEFLGFSKLEQDSSDLAEPSPDNNPVLDQAGTYYEEKDWPENQDTKT